MDQSNKSPEHLQNRLENKRSIPYKSLVPKVLWRVYLQPIYLPQRGTFEQPDNSQLIAVCLGVCTALSIGNGKEISDEPIYTNTIQRYFHISNNQPSGEIRLLKKVFLSNRSITCNDGSQSGFYLRKSYTSKKWVLFLEGGGYCYDESSCNRRWLSQRHLMTSSQWTDSKDVGGILSPNREENPYWYNANHVFVPYCTSDSWSGTRSTKRNMFKFMGSLVVQQVIKDLLPLGLENSTDLLLTGSSAGGTGVMINLDLVKEQLHQVLNLKQIAVRGVADSGWFIDRTPYSYTKHPAVDAIRKGMQFWQGKVPRKCRLTYPAEPWRCYFGYRLYPTLRAPLFIFQWLFDEVQMDADNVRAPRTSQEWDFVHKMGDALRNSFENVSAVFAPSCISHSVLTKRDWIQVKINEISIADAIHCWEQQPLRNAYGRNYKIPILSDEPSLPRPQKNQLPKKDLRKKKRTNDRFRNCSEKIRNKKRKRKHRKNKTGKNKREKGKRRRDRINCNNSSRHYHNQINSLQNRRPPRSTAKTQKRSSLEHCPHRHLEKCSWPQCNRSCPRFLHPVTGEEMGIRTLLMSYGLNLPSMAEALGIDMPTLNNMENGELLRLLTQNSDSQ